MNANPSNVNMATPKPMIDAANAAGSQPSGPARRREAAARRRAGPRNNGDDHPHLEEQSQPLVVQNRGITKGIVETGLSCGKPLTQQRLPTRLFEHWTKLTNASASEQGIRLSMVNSLLLNKTILWEKCVLQGCNGAGNCKLDDYDKRHRQGK